MLYFYRRLRLPVPALLSMIVTLLLVSSFATSTVSAAARPLKHPRPIHPATIGVGNSPAAVAKGDFNGDGILDLVTANFGDNTVSVLVGRGDGTFAPAVAYPVGNGPESVAVGDFNGDGRLDLVTTNSRDNR